MSADMAHDMYIMHNKFGAHDWFEKNKHDKELMSKFLTFRLNMCLEELLETATASGVTLENDEDGFVFRGDNTNGDPEEIVDGLIDLCVFALGTLDVFGIDTKAAWDNVYKANMNKNVGVKAGRPNPFGLPDLIKPDGWTAPSHEGNHGNLDKALK
jgi:hypothetical protein